MKEEEEKNEEEEEGERKMNQPRVCTTIRCWAVTHDIKQEFKDDL